MSYAYNNHRNYSMDTPNRRAAQVAHNNWTQAAQQQQRAINRVSRDYLSGGANAVSWPNHTSWRNLHIAEAAQPYGEQMENYHNQRMHAMQNYMDNEMTQVQDRFADMHENRISSKNNSDEMAAALKAQEIAAAERMNSVNANALGSMSQSLMSPGIKAPGVGGSGNMPNTSLYNRNGQRIGGTYFS